MGILSGIASSPCATPVLAAILGFVAQRGNILYGGALLLIYSLAHCPLIILAGISTGFLQTLSNNSRMMIWGKVLRFTMGGAVILSVVFTLYMLLPLSGRWQPAPHTKRACRSPG